MGLPKELAALIGEFASVARVVVGVTNLKIFGFGPRPQDFFACNAPVQPGASWYEEASGRTAELTPRLSFITLSYSSMKLTRLLLSACQVSLPRKRGISRVDWACAW